MPYTTVIRLPSVVRNPANGFPARLLDNVGQSYDLDHNLHALFKKLPESHQRAVESRYAHILADRIAEAWDFQRTVDAFLEYLGDDPMTDTRYFWERGKSNNASVMFISDSLRHLIDALIVELHGYPEGNPLEKRYKTNFRSFEESWELRIRTPTEQVAVRPNKRIGAHIFWLKGILDYFNARVPYSHEEHRRLVVCHRWSDGYSDLSLMRASLVVKRQSTLMVFRLRGPCQAWVSCCSVF